MLLTVLLATSIMDIMDTSMKVCKAMLVCF